MEQHDSGALVRAAHAAKDALGYFSNGKAVRAALRLQQMGVEGDLRDARQTTAKLDVEQIESSLMEFGRTVTQ